MSAATAAPGVWSHRLGGEAGSTSRSSQGVAGLTALPVPCPWPSLCGQAGPSLSHCPRQGAPSPARSMHRWASAPGALSESGCCHCSLVSLWLQDGPRREHPPSSGHAGPPMSPPRLSEPRPHMCGGHRAPGQVGERWPAAANLCPGVGAGLLRSGWEASRWGPRWPKTAGSPGPAGPREGRPCRSQLALWGRGRARVASTFTDEAVRRLLRAVGGGWGRDPGQPGFPPHVGGGLYLGGPLAWPPPREAPTCPERLRVGTGVTRLRVSWWPQGGSGGFGRKPHQLPPSASRTPRWSPLTQPALGAGCPT